MARAALVFAGQGAQAAGMGAELAAAYADCKSIFERADEVLGFGLSKLCFEGPEEELTKSNICQPAIFVTSLACFKALELEGGAGDWSGAAGLSLGEWTALHAAGALSFEDALRVLEARGRFMQEACEARAGGMVSVIGLPLAKVEEIARAAGVSVANLNSDAQVVLSGEKAAVGEAAAMAQAAGAKRAIALNVAGAYHSSLMQPAADRLRDVLAGVAIVEPRIPVLSNVTGQPHGTPEDIRRDMVRQVTSSVRWLDCVGWFGRQGVNCFVECGPGNVLSGLIRRIDGQATVCNIQDGKSLQRALETLKGPA